MPVRIASGGPARPALERRPAVVFALLDAIDLFRVDSPTSPHQSSPVWRSNVKRHGLRNPRAKICGSAAGASTSMRTILPSSVPLGGEAGDERRAAVADADVELAVGTERDGARRVVERRPIDAQDQRLGPGIERAAAVVRREADHVGAMRQRGIATGGRALRGQEDVRLRRMQRDAEQRRVLEVRSIDHRDRVLERLRRGLEPDAAERVRRSEARRVRGARAQAVDDRRCSRLAREALCTPRSGRRPRRPRSRGGASNA